MSTAAIASLRHRTSEDPWKLSAGATPKAKTSPFIGRSYSKLT
jgi:hypothetical protein